VRIPAASYFTACDEELSNSDVRRMNRGCRRMSQDVFGQKVWLTDPVDRVPFTVQLNNLNDAHLKQLVHVGDLVKVLQDILHGLGHSAVRQKHKRVSLASCIRLGSEECLD